MRLLTCVLLLFYCTTKAQTFKYARDPIPIALTGTNELQFVNRGHYTHVWVYNKKKLQLVVFNQNLNRTALHKRRKASATEKPLFAFTDAGPYCVGLRTGKGWRLLRVDKDGQMSEHLPPFAQLQFVGAGGNHLFLAESTPVDQRLGPSIVRMDTAMRVREKLSLPPPDATAKPQYTFRPLNDSAILCMEASTDPGNHSRLRLWRINMVRGKLDTQSIESNRFQFHPDRAEVDAKGNLYLFYQTIPFGDSLQQPADRYTTHIVKVNNDWTLGNTVTLARRKSGWGDLNSATPAAFLLGPHLALVNLYTSINEGFGGSSTGRSRHTENDQRARQLLTPQQSQEQARWQQASRNSASTARPADLDPRIESSIDARDLFQSGPPQERRVVEVGPPLPFRPVFRLFEFAAADTALQTLANWTIPTPEACFAGTDRLHCFSNAAPHTIVHTELHPLYGNVNSHRHALNPMYSYFTSLMAQQKPTSFLLPYAYKRKLFFAVMQLE